MGPEVLAQVLRGFPPIRDPRVIVGNDPSEDAAVVRVSKDLALVLTVDFFIPVVDDPRDFGAIAAANALSDVYAMGARPLYALNITAFPSQGLSHGILKDILKGGREKAAEAGVLILGGHTVDDNEPKYGLSVVGSVHPKKLVTAGGGRAGDSLVLTKPLGVGIITTAIKKGLASKKDAASATAQMKKLNKDASEAMVAAGAGACTDVTGFGLLGHLHTVTKASKVGAEIFFGSIPFIPRTMQFAEQGVFPGGAERNQRFTAAFTRWAGEFPETVKILLNDPQTSGGLLIAISAKRKSRLFAELKRRKVGFAEIGRLVKDSSNGIIVR